MKCWLVLHLHGINAVNTVNMEGTNPKTTGARLKRFSSDASGIRSEIDTSMGAEYERI